MKNMTLDVIAKACGGVFHGLEEQKAVTISGITIDSRKIEEGFLFVALRGERVDGHSFVAGAYEKGAKACLVEDASVQAEGPYIVVKSCTQALKDIAEYYRSILNIKVVGITGSVGKTSTKEMIASVLEQKYSVLKTQGNFNNEIGVPLTIFSIKEEHEVAVLEMGISDFGEMHRLSKMARPDICVITNIGQCHLENLKSRDGILQAKSEIFDFAKESCTAVLNGDDDKLITLKGRDGIHSQFFGMDDSFDIHAENVVDHGLEGITCDICYGKERVNVWIPIPGTHMVYNALAGAMVGLQLGLTKEEIKAGVEALKPTGGRNNILQLNGMTVIDDCYNANPVSMRSSLDVLAKAEGRKVAILGDMGELGADELALHYGVGEYAAQKNIDVFVCVGTLSEEMKKGAESVRDSETQILYCKTKEELLQGLDGIVKDGDTVLVKASHFMQFDKIVEAFR
ncbi:MAG: UDP-N-acetylmuramoyl-tripeptide--D-alanyl-D-alanine ligase [Clostridium sp.]|nr:UDP-N-acetylmuramoyl-tripeptide--D-alanyl-D-alanine ligase [Clostridium sp.]